MRNRDGTQECLFHSGSEQEEIYERGYRFWNDGAFEHATACFADIAISNPQERRFIFAFACALKQQGETRHALTLFMHCIVLQADEPWAYFHIACCLSVLGNIAEARDALDASLTLCQPLSDQYLYQQAKNLLADLSY